MGLISSRRRGPGGIAKQVRTRSGAGGPLTAWNDLRPFLWPSRGQLLLLSFVAVVAGFLEAGVLVLIVKLAFAVSDGVDAIELGIGPVGNVTVTTTQLFVATFVLGVLRLAMQALAAYLGPRVSAYLQRDLRARAFRAYLMASWDAQSKQQEGRFLEFATVQIGKASSGVGVVTSGITQGFNLVAIVLSAFLVDLSASVVIVVSVVVLFLGLRPLAVMSRRWSALQADAGVEYSTGLIEMVRATQEIKVLHVEDRVLERADQRIRAYTDALRNGQVLSALTPSLYQGIALLLVLIGLAVVSSSSVVDIASLGSVVLLLFRALTYSQSLQGTYQGLNDLAPFAEVVNETFTRFEAERDVHAGEPLEAMGDVAFDDVRFAYRDGHEVLHDLNFTLARGEAIGIVGPSGAGKSTVVQLLLRLRRPTGGRVLVGGQDLAGVAAESWYAKVGLVPQDPLLIEATVADNIRLFRDTVSLEEVEQAARLAHLHDEIMATPDGYDTVIGPRDKALSGGQRQRLALARALAGKPEILILDEPTSALDMRSERAVHESLAGLRGQMTLVIVAHRLSTLNICDRIMVLEKGQLAAFLPPGELKEKNAFFRDAVELSKLSMVDA